jgi:hypothetical protein
LNLFQNLNFINSPKEITILEDGFTWLNIKFYGETPVFQQQTKESDEK